jgi:hypothetical protein
VARTGADPEQLRATADRFERAADQLELIDRRTTGRLRTAPWSGPDAERFARRWRSNGSPAVLRAAVACRASARELREQARAQVTASDGTTIGAGPPRPGPANTPSAAAGRPDPPSDPPLRSERARLSAGGHAAILGGRGEQTLQIDQLNDGRLVVTVEESLHGGLMARAPAPVSGSHLEATAGGARRREWTIRSTELPLLMAALGLEASPIGALPRAVDAAADLADGALGLVGIRTDLDRWSAIPGLADTTAVEHLAVVGTAGAAGLGPLRVGSEGTVAVGRRSSASGEQTVLEWSESVTGRLRAPWSTSLARSLGVEWEPRSGATLEGRIELPDPSSPDPGDQPARIRIQSTVGSERTVIDAVVVLGPSGDRSSGLGAAAAALANGDTRAAVQVIAGTTLTETASWRITGYGVDQHRVSLPASVGVAGISPDGSWERAVRR